MAYENDVHELMRELGSTLVRERNRRLVAVGRVSQTPLGGHAVAEMVGLALPRVREYCAMQKAGPTSPVRKAISGIIKEFGIHKAVALTTRAALDLCSSGGLESRHNNSLSGVRAAIASQWLLEQDYVLFAEESGVATASDAWKMGKRGARHLQARSNALKRQGHRKGCTWDRADVTAAVAVVLDCIIQTSGIFVLTRSHRPEGAWGSSSKKSKYSQVLSVSEHFQEWLLGGIERMAEIAPVKVPLNEPPGDWDENGVGGYAADSPISLHILGNHQAARGQQFDGRSCPDLLRALNTIQRTSWRINRKVLEVFDVAIQNNWRDTGYTFEIHPDPGEYPEHGDVDDRNFWKRERRRHLVSEQQYRASKLRAGRTRYVATIFDSEKPVYFAHHLDFRGRAYPASSLLHYQGRDAERALLEFYEGKPLGTDEGLRWFLIHGANRFGEDKCSLDDRIMWVHENHAKIMAVGEDPYSNRWWLDASNPWQFLAWCLEYSEMRNGGDPLDFVSHIPVAMDGSNNGLQIYSLLFRDEVGGRATNCVPCDSPQDAYQTVADLVTEKVRSVRDTPPEDEEGIKYQRYAQQFFKLLDRMDLTTLPRRAVKRAVMTQPYGCTKFTVQRYVIDWYFEWVRDLNIAENDRPLAAKDVYGLFRWLGDMVWESISEVIVKAREAMDWIQSISETLTEHGHQLQWTSPIGLKVNQGYCESEFKMVRTRVGADIRVRVQVFQDKEDTIDARRAVNGSCPNFVHSLDASAMFHTVNLASMEGVTHFQMIHDSFGTHAADAPVLARCLRDAYIDIFTEDVVDRAYREWQDLVPQVKLPAPPSRGSLDIQQLKNADYFFA